MSDKSKDELEDRVAELEATVQKMLPNRRQALKGMAGAAGFTALGFSAGNASAQADTSDGDGNIGTPSDRVDIFADGIDANTLAQSDAEFDSLETGTLNSADLATAATDTVPVAQGDGTLAMGSVEFSEKVVQSVVYAGHPDFSGIQDAIDFCESNGHHTVVVPAGEEASNITISTEGICLVGLGGPAAGTNGGRVEINGVNVSKGTVIKNIRHSGNWSIGADRCRLDTISGYNTTLTIDSNDNIISGYMDESLSEIVLNGNYNTVTASGGPSLTDNGDWNEVLG